MIPKLKDRIEQYQAVTDYKLLKKLPVIISINGRSFSKATSLLDKPYDEKFAECMHSTMQQLCVEIDGSTFAFTHSDQIIIIAQNDQSQETSAWFDNKLQKICSATAAIATLHFSKCANYIDLNLMGDPIFTSQVFVVPNISETINTIIYNQQHNFMSSIQLACFYELLNKHDKNSIKDMLAGLSIDEKIDLLYQECSINFDAYVSDFRRGSACYRVPKIADDGTIKHKWMLNKDLPIFTKEQGFLNGIFRSNE